MNRRRSSTPATASSPGEVRVIAGRLRGSKLPVAGLAGLRPTPARVRETLFNWLQDVIPGRRVLDLFAGTGALGIEAASRGAAEVQLVERDARLAESLRASVARLKADPVRVDCADALAWLARAPDRRFDVVFLDPPFAGELWNPVLLALAPWLAEDAWIHVESPPEQALALPAGWQLYREGRTREVHYRLYRAGGGGTVTLPPIPKADTPTPA